MTCNEIRILIQSGQFGMEVWENGGTTVSSDDVDWTSGYFVPLRERTQA